MKLVDAKTGITLSTNNIPYGSFIYVKPGDKVAKGDVICSWDPYNGVIISEFAGKVSYENIEQGITYQVEIDEQTGFQEKVISESRNKKLIPTLHIEDSKGNTLRSYNLPVGAHLMIDDGEKISVGKVLVKIPRKSAKTGDITGGLPRVTELFEARNPSNPAVVSEIDGVVSFGKIKRGNREIIIESKLGEVKKYLVKLSNQILVQENDYVKAGMPLSDGSITPEGNVITTTTGQNVMTISDDGIVVGKKLNTTQPGGGQSGMSMANTNSKLDKLVSLMSARNEQAEVQTKKLGRDMNNSFTAR